MKYTQIAEYWDVDGLIKADDDPKKEHKLYLNAFSENHCGCENECDCEYFTLEDFEMYIRDLKEAKND